MVEHTSLTAFSVSILTVFTIFSFVNPGKSYKDPLIALLVIIFSRWCLDLGIIEKNHISAVKTLLLKILFPIFVFVDLTKMNRNMFIDMLKFPVLALLHNFLIFGFGGLFVYYCLYKTNLFIWPCAFGVMLEMGSLAPGTTVYPFTKNMGDNAKDEHPQNVAMMSDIGNKLWTLLIIALIIGKATGGNLSVRELCLKVIKMPVTIAFLFAITFILIGINVSDNMEITGAFFKKMGDLAPTVMLIFIGLKLQFPRKEQLDLFIPIFARRTFTQFVVVCYQLIFEFKQKEFMALVVFFNAANSIWPYVHLQTILPDPKNKSIVDAEYILQIVIYDYALAVFLNMAYSTFQFNVLVAEGIILIYLALTILFTFFTYRNKVFLKKEDLK